MKKLLTVFAAMFLRAQTRMKKTTRVRRAVFFMLTLLMFPAAVFGQGGNTGQDDPYVPPAGKYTSAEEMRDKRIGVLTGTCFDEVAKEQFPDAQLLYYNSQPDMLTALTSGKIDAYLYDEPVIIYMMGENHEITYIPETLASYDYAYAFPKTDSGRNLCDEMSAYIRQIRSDGTLDQIRNTWLMRDEENWDLADYEHFPAVNGKLTMATDATSAPFTMIYRGGITGIDIDIVVRFCEAYGYGLTISNMGSDARLPAIQSGKADFVGSALSVTPERKESVLFSEPYCVSDVVFVVLRSEEAVRAGAKEEEEETGFWNGIRNSFRKTFIREERWKLFLQGLLTTLNITLVSILAGTLLGFVLFLLCRNGNRIANGITRICLWLVQGMPTVVFLMIFYYIIFGKLSIGGTAVSMICFTLIFAAAVFGLLKMGVGAVDPGQYEAAYALGYSDRRTFFKVILPQALPHVVPGYKGEITGLLKATSVVGYIAVQDLTKMGDLVRSRTYEAFFPLISVAVIYFGLEGVLGFIVGRISRLLDPKRRRGEDVLKGVNTGDQN